jgi:hypothetical protein
LKPPFNRQRRPDKHTDRHQCDSCGSSCRNPFWRYWANNRWLRPGSRPPGVDRSGALSSRCAKSHWRRPLQRGPRRREAEQNAGDSTETATGRLYRLIYRTIKRAAAGPVLRWRQGQRLFATSALRPVTEGVRSVSRSRGHRQSRTDASGASLPSARLEGATLGRDPGVQSGCGVAAIAPFCPLGRRWPVHVTCFCGATRACEGTSHASLRLGSLGITLWGRACAPCWWLCQSPPNRYRQQRWEPR